MTFQSLKHTPCVCYQAATRVTIAPDGRHVVVCEPDNSSGAVYLVEDGQLLMKIGGACEAVAFHVESSLLVYCKSVSEVAVLSLLDGRVLATTMLPEKPSTTYRVRGLEMNRQTLIVHREHRFRAIVHLWQGELTIFNRQTNQ